MSLKNHLYIRPAESNKAAPTKSMASPIPAGYRPWIGWRMWSFLQDTLAAVAGRSHLLLVIFAGLVAGLILLVPLYLLLRTIGV